MDSECPRLSVIVPMYNIARWLPTCLKSIAAQTLPSRDFEVILIDDASTDDTVEISREFCSRYDNFRCIELKEHTPGSEGIPVNMALDQARGEYISMIDGDDFIEPDMFELLLQRAEETRADLIFFSYRIYYEQEQRYAPALDQDAWQTLCQAERAGASLRELQQSALLPIVYWRKLYRREFMEQFHIRHPEGFIGTDQVLNWYCVVQARSISAVDKVLYNYRVGRSGQMSAIRDSSRLFTLHDHARRIQDFLIKIHRYEEFKSEFFCWYLNVSRWTLPEMKTYRKEYLRRLQAFCQKEVDWARLQDCRRVGCWGIRPLLQCWFMLHGCWNTGQLVWWCLGQAARLRNLCKNLLGQKNVPVENPPR